MSVSELLQSKDYSAFKDALNVSNLDEITEFVSWDGDTLAMEIILSDPDYLDKLKDTYAIVWAACMNDITLVKDLLQNPNVQPEFRCNMALSWACSRGNVEMYDLLIADPRVIPASVNLRAAVHRNHLPLVRRILDDSRLSEVNFCLHETLSLNIYQEIWNRAHPETDLVMLYLEMRKIVSSNRVDILEWLMTKIADLSPFIYIDNENYPMLRCFFSEPKYLKLYIDHPHSILTDLRQKLDEFHPDWQMMLDSDPKSLTYQAFKKVLKTFVYRPMTPRRFTIDGDNINVDVKCHYTDGDPISEKYLTKMSQTIKHRTPTDKFSDLFNTTFGATNFSLGPISSFFLS